MHDIERNQEAMGPSPKTRRTPSTRPTISDVAHQAGVSIMTVSRIINGKGPIRKTTRDAVDAAIASLKYVPNSAARSLAGNRTVRIGLLYDNRYSGLMSEMLLGCLDQARNADVYIMVRVCRNHSDAINVVKKLIRTGIDGIILPPPLCEAPSLLAFLDESRTLAVTVASSLPKESRLSVRIDDHEAAAAMTRHILGLGHCRVGFIGGHPALSASAERLRGYQTALGEQGISVDPALVVAGEFTYHSGLTAAERLLDIVRPPTAIFASNDDMAAAAVAVAHRRGLDVPADLTVCGFDDTMLSTTVWPNLTTIHQPIARMAATAVEILADMHNCGIGVPGQGGRRVLDYRLIRRGSDAALWSF
jgi:LacI family transcriptional regulator